MWNDECGIQESEFRSQKREKYSGFWLLNSEFYS
jgi:hypothetical protein